MIRGQSTHGYGQTIRIVREAHAKGMTIPQAAAAYNTSQKAVRTCAWRLKIRMRSESGKAKYGTVKAAAIFASENNLTANEAAKLFKLKPWSIRRMVYEMGLKIPYERSKNTD